MGCTSDDWFNILSDSMIKSEGDTNENVNDMMGANATNDNNNL